MKSITERGFITYDEFTDDDGVKIIVRESSAYGMGHVWIFMDEGKSALHLTAGQATRLSQALDEFIKDRRMRQLPIAGKVESK